MEESRELAAVLEGGLEERLVERVLTAAREVPAVDRVQAGVEAAIEQAELDPEGTRHALEALRSNPIALQRLESELSLPPNRATLALGAAIQLIRSELVSTEPDLRSRMSELLRWLQA